MMDGIGDRGARYIEDGAEGAINAEGHECRRR